MKNTRAVILGLSIGLIGGSLVLGATVVKDQYGRSIVLNPNKEPDTYDVTDPDAASVAFSLTCKPGCPVSSIVNSTNALQPDWWDAGTP
jgi:hypothetical protein